MAGKSHLQDYLEYYCSLEVPQYAVLVTGDWGTGKTYQVRKILPKDKAYYVSLFGRLIPVSQVTTTSSVHNRFCIFA